jgi:segregation and condensation protein B
MADHNPAENSLDAPQNGMPDTGSLIPHIEALIFASDKPLTNLEIVDLVNAAFGFTDAADRIAAEQVDAALEGIVEKYSTEAFPFEVRQSGGGWQFLTKKTYHKTVAQLNGEKFLKKLSGAALETLAIIAYKQPITKGEIESIRGVSSDYSVQKLLEKDLIIITGRNEKLPGHPLVYATSKSFMDYFGINSADDLPKIREVLAEQAVIPAVVNHTEEDGASVLVVTDAGELIDAEESTTLPGTNGNGAAGNARLFIDESHTAGNGITPPEEERDSETATDE